MKPNRLFITLSLISFCTLLFAQLPDTDIFLTGIKKEGGKYTFTTPENITKRNGYDNQPCFSKDGKSILYVSVVDTTQSDIYSVDLQSKKISQLTNTKESEFSPTYSPDGKNLTVVRVDQDSGQRAYLLPENSLTSAQQIKGTDSIGYFCWLNDSLLSMFILGPANTLQVLNIHTGQRTLIASDIGRCLKLAPDKKSLTFVVKANEKEWFIYSMNIQTLKTERLVQTISGNEDFAFLPDNTLLMGSEGKLYSWKAGSDTQWNELADFSSTVHAFYRISVNADGSRLALVAFTGQKP